MKDNEKIHAIESEILTYHKRNNKEKSAWATIEIIEKILDGSYFDIPSCSDSTKESDDEQEWAFDEKIWKGPNSTPKAKVNENGC